MARKVSFVVRATPAVGALLAFAHATRAHRSGLGERVEREVRLALDGAARTLDPVLAPLRWLARRGCARATGYVDATGLAAETVVSFDLRAAVAAALAAGARVDSRAYTDLYSLRALVRALRAAEAMTFDAVALGRQPTTPRALLRVVEAACRETALADEATTPKAFARPVASGPAPVPAPPRARTASPPPPVSSQGAFGGLPDDATSPPVAPAEPMSPRGLTLDAEFFLEQARLRAWPCSEKLLSRARRAVLIALHPDRAGAGSEDAFRRASRGFEHLVKSLAAGAPVATTPLASTPPPAPPVAPPAARVAPTPAVAPQAAVASAPAARIGQWPPPPDAVPVAAAPPTRRRQSFSRSSKA